MTNTLIAADDVTKAFSEEAGVFDLSFEIPQGKIVGFVGPSGSGKTTTVRLMTGLHVPDSGRMTVLGIDPLNFDTSTREKIGYLPQSAVLYPDLTLDQNLSFAASLYGLGRSAATDDLVDLLDLSNALGRLPDEASGGEKRRLMLASSMVHSPTLLFLDEPTAGIDPVLRRRIWDRLQEISTQGTSMVVTTQYVGEAAYCDLVAVLAAGRLVAFETPEGLRTKAYGGELVDVTLARPPSRTIVEDLEAALEGNHLKTIDSRTVRLVVPNAGQAGTVVTDWARAKELELEESRVHVPPFDDVFVELMEAVDSGEGQPEEGDS